MISDILFPEIEKRFPSLGYRKEDEDGPMFVIPPKFEDYGTTYIQEDGDEITIYLGRFTHGHFSNYDNTLSDVEKEKEITEDVIDFLEDLFSDRVVAWGKNTGIGGWKRLSGGTLKKSRFTKYYTWSGRK